MKVDLANGVRIILDTLQTTTRGGMCIVTSILRASCLGDVTQGVAHG